MVRDKKKKKKHGARRRAQNRFPQFN